MSTPLRFFPWREWGLDFPILFITEWLSPCWPGFSPRLFSHEIVEANDFIGLFSLTPLTFYP